MIQLTAMYLILVKNCHVSKKDSSRDGLFGDSPRLREADPAVPNNWCTAGGV